MYFNNNIVCQFVILRERSHMTSARFWQILPPPPPPTVSFERPPPPLMTSAFQSDIDFSKNPLHSTLIETLNVYQFRGVYLDNLSFVSNIASTTTSIKSHNKSFFFRTHTLWNSLPFDIRNSIRLSQFKFKLAKHFWSKALSDNEQPEHEWSFQSSDEGG